MATVGVCSCTLIRPYLEHGNVLLKGYSELHETKCRKNNPKQDNDEVPSNPTTSSSLTDTEEAGDRKTNKGHASP